MDETFPKPEQCRCGTPMKPRSVWSVIFYRFYLEMYCPKRRWWNFWKHDLSRAK